ncbi:MAG: hypothetical protein PHN44_04520, partial [Candidatus Marinimicrobia bacterium]|nr:hypothetical protein [Candidatus Neomarinimicrobiota bacterium]
MANEILQVILKVSKEGFQNIAQMRKALGELQTGREKLDFSDVSGLNKYNQKIGETQKNIKSLTT